MMWRRFALAAAILVAAAAGSVDAQQKPKQKPVLHRVTIDATSFKPAELTIRAGDSVVWMDRSWREGVRLRHDGDRRFVETHLQDDRRGPLHLHLSSHDERADHDPVITSRTWMGRYRSAACTSANRSSRSCRCGRSYRPPCSDLPACHRQRRVPSCPPFEIPTSDAPIDCMSPAVSLRLSSVVRAPECGAEYPATLPEFRRLPRRQNPESLNL